MHLHRSSASPWRWPAAAGLLITAAVHIDIAPEHLREAPYAGVLFILLSAAALTCATLLVATNHPLVWTAAAALSLAALIAYLMSRSIGLPSLSDDVGDWVTALGLTAVLSEAAVLLISWHVLSGYRTATETVRLYTVASASPSEPAGYV